jgi:hypothetical protein
MRVSLSAFSQPLHTADSITVALAPASMSILIGSSHLLFPVILIGSSSSTLTGTRMSSVVMPSSFVCPQIFIFLTNRSFHFEFDQPVELDRIFQRQPLHHRRGESTDYHFHGALFIDAAAGQIEKLFVADPADPGFMGEFDILILYDSAWKRI